MAFTQLEVVSGDLVTSADLAHLRLRKAFDRIVEDYWAVADAIHEAHDSEAWMRDDGEHEPRYRRLMTEQGMLSIFRAYCYDEFGLRDAYVGYIDVAGRLRAATQVAALATGVDWSRFTLTGVRPISAAIVDTYEPDDIAHALATAQRLASNESAAHPKPGRNTDEYHDRAPVLGRHVRAALVEHGMVPPRAVGVAELESSERRAVQLERAEQRAERDMEYLIRERRRKAVVTIITDAIARLGDHPASLARIRIALDEVTS